MPFTLTTHSPSHLSLRAWPHNALPARGFVMAIVIAASSLSIPLLAVLGSPILWGLLPFAGLAVWGLWYGLQRNWRDRQIVEEMEITRSGVHLRRINPRGPAQEWQADPYWLALHLHPRGGPVEHYLTLTGGGREVELGAFLTPEERMDLHDRLSQALIDLKSHAPRG